MKKILLFIFLAIPGLFLNAQPWENPLKIAWSTDGQNFGTPVIFQDSAGVPSVVRWKGDTLVCAFQWFPGAMGGPGWDSVAVKFSYDLGISWTEPTSIVIHGMPPGYQRPFDPTLVVLNSDTMRMYFSGSETIPTMGLDSTVNTYSAFTTDGVNYYFDSNARVDQPSDPVIDPAVIFFDTAFHYTAPKGAPWEGAHHYTSADGLNFTPAAPIPSDSMHNWTGNLILRNSGEMRFYGSGNYIWFNSTFDGFNWMGYIWTNIQGGDPTVLQLDTNSYLMIYVGHPYGTGIEESENHFVAYPNPTSDFCKINSKEEIIINFAIFNLFGQQVQDLKTVNCSELNVDLSNYASGIYFIQGESSNGNFSIRVVKE